jgi:hypothetical protein
VKEWNGNGEYLVRHVAEAQKAVVQQRDENGTDEESAQRRDWLRRGSRVGRVGQKRLRLGASPTLGLAGNGRREGLQRQVTRRLAKPTTSLHTSFNPRKPNTNPAKASAAAMAQGKRYGNSRRIWIFPKESGKRVAGFANVPPMNGLATPLNSCSTSKKKRNTPERCAERPHNRHKGINLRDISRVRDLTAKFWSDMRPSEHKCECRTITSAMTLFETP